MQTTPTTAGAPRTTGYSKHGLIGTSSTHVWGRCSQDPRVWSVIPIAPSKPVWRGVPDDFGTLVSVGEVQ